MTTGPMRSCPSVGGAGLTGTGSVNTWLAAGAVPDAAAGVAPAGDVAVAVAGVAAAVPATGAVAAAAPVVVAAGVRTAAAPAALSAGFKVAPGSSGLLCTARGRCGRCKWCAPARLAFAGPTAGIPVAGLDALVLSVAATAGDFASAWPAAPVAGTVILVGAADALVSAALVFVPCCLGEPSVFTTTTGVSLPGCDKLSGANEPRMVLTVNTSAMTAAAAPASHTARSPTEAEAAQCMTLWTLILSCVCVCRW